MKELLRPYTDQFGSTLECALATFMILLFSAVMLAMLGSISLWIPVIALVLLALSVAFASWMKADE